MGTDPSELDAILETLWPDGSLDQRAPTTPATATRSYPHAVIEELGAGGMGRVLRVRDALLGRNIALKELSGALQHPRARARFVNEAILTARLEHPGVVPVHALGVLEDGTPWYTMREVRGTTLEDRIAALHRGERTGGLSLRRLLDAFHRACETVAYAHAHGVIHRDLKPSNILVGDHGQTWVVDWGLAKQVGQDDETVAAVPDTTDPLARGLTRHGDVAGTPGFLAPEQAMGELALLQPHTDVFALGAVLFAICTGEPPYDTTDALLALAQVASGPPPELAARLAAAPGLPSEIAEICSRCLAFLPTDRYCDAGEIVADLEAWADGTRRRERASELVDEAHAQGRAAESLRHRVRALREEAAAVLDALPTTAPEHAKHDAWTLEDEAERLGIEAEVSDADQQRLLLAALTHDPEHIEAHAALAERWRDVHERAEASRDPAGAARAEVGITAHADALPADHPTRRRCRDWLAGDGWITLHSEPAAEVEVERYVEVHRRLVLEPFDRWSGPVDARPIPRGSYRLTLRADGRHPVHYAVRIDRQAHWNPVRPGSTDVHPVWLPPLGALGPDDCYVPAGPARFGGDPEVEGALPDCTAWVDDFAIRRFPVTHREFLAFLEDLLHRGDESAVRRFEPRERTSGGGDGSPLYRREGGHLALPDLPAIGLDDPVILVDPEGVDAFTAWMRERDGLPWRLPTEWEWEKAARGVDGRLYPWGDWIDPTWCAAREVQVGHAKPASVHDFPVDQSPYGVRGLAGNVQDWCAPPWLPHPHAPEVTPREGPSPDGIRPARGGYWFGFTRFSRAAYRVGLFPGGRSPNVGFRLARDLPREPAGPR